MDTSVLVALVALGGAAISAAFTFFASRRSSDDSHTIGLINAGQTALENALERTTAEVLDARKQILEMRAETARQTAEMRTELTQVRVELDTALLLHAECERHRTADAIEIAKLRAIVERNHPNE